LLNVVHATKRNLPLAKSLQRGTFISSTLIDASRVDEPIDYVVADISGDPHSLLDRRQPHRVRVPPRPRAAQEWTSLRAAPILSYGGRKRRRTDRQTNCRDEQYELDRLG